MNLSHLRAAAERTGGPVGRTIAALVDIAEEAWHVASQAYVEVPSGASPRLADDRLLHALQRLDKEAKE